MSSDFYALIPSRANPAKPVESSEDFIKYLSSFLDISESWIDPYCISRTVSYFLLELESKKRLPKLQKAYLDSRASSFFTLISDRDVLFQQTRERGELLGEKRSHRNLALHRNGVTLDNLKLYGSSPSSTRQCALHFSFERYRSDCMQFFQTQHKDLVLAKQALSRFEDRLDDFLDPIKPVLAEIIAYCVEHHRKVEQIYGKFSPNISSYQDITQVFIPYQEQQISIHDLLLAQAPSAATLSREQLTILATQILPLYIKEERHITALRDERIQQSKLSLALSEKQYEQFRRCSSTRDSLQKQWDSAVTVLTHLRQTYAPSHFKLDNIELYEDSCSDKLPSDFSPFCDFSPLEQLVINFRYHSAVEQDDLYESVLSILDKPDKLGESAWHFWRPTRRNTELIRHLIILLRKRGIEPDSSDGLAQIDALLLFTGFTSYALHHPKAVNRLAKSQDYASKDSTADPLANFPAEKLLVNRVLSEIQQCVGYSIIDCLCFDPTLFLLIDCPNDPSGENTRTNNSAVAPFEKLLLWMDDPRTSLSGLKGIEIERDTFQQYRNLFESPDTSRESMAKFLQPLCDEFNWDSIKFYPLARYNNKPDHLNGMRLLLTEYALLLKLIAETRHNLLEIFQALLDLSLGQAL